MTEVSSLSEPIGAIKPIDLSMVTSGDVAAYDRASMMSETLSDALGNAMIAPKPNEAAGLARENFLKGSEATRFDSEDGSITENVSSAPGEAAKPDPMDVVIERMKGLYSEVTNFNVAWSIARRSGKDLETLLRG